MHLCFFCGWWWTAVDCGPLLEAPGFRARTLRRSSGTFLSPNRRNLKTASASTWRWTRVGTDRTALRLRSHWERAEVEQFDCRFSYVWVFVVFLSMFAMGLPRFSYFIFPYCGQTDADPTSHRVRLWRGGSASKVLLLRVFFPRVRPHAHSEV